MRIRSIEYDFDSETIMVGFEDGSVQRESLALSNEQRPTSIRHYRLDFATGRLELRLPNGSTATAELAIPGASDQLMLAGRLIVYLDQNLWSRLSAARYGQRVIPPQEHAAGITLTQLVADRSIILPVSAGHFLETGRHRGPNRLPLVSTLLELCGGWQMRHPGVVGARELGRCGQGRALGQPLRRLYARAQLDVPAAVSCASPEISGAAGQHPVQRDRGDCDIRHGRRPVRADR